MEARLVADAAVKAAVLEAGAEKPGNVTPTKSFEDLQYSDFVDAAHRMRTHIEEAAKAGAGLEAGMKEGGLGRLIYTTFQPTRANANFGIVLMFVPLAMAAGRGEYKDLRTNLKKVLSQATPEDTVWIYKAMRKVDLGGMEIRDESLADLDVFSDSALEKIEDERLTPLDVFSRVSDIDRLASEWVGGYDICFKYVKTVGLDESSIIRTYLEILAEYPDTFIARKSGLESAETVSDKAREVLAGKLDIDEFDSYLRSRGNSLNPGTTADLIATVLFIKLLE